MVTPPETFTDVLSTLCIVCREREKQERDGAVVVKKYPEPCSNQTKLYLSKKRKKKKEKKNFCNSAA